AVVRVRLRDAGAHGPGAVPVEEGRSRDRPDLGAVLSGGASEGNADVGHGGGPGCCVEPGRKAGDAARRAPGFAAARPDDDEDTDGAAGGDWLLARGNSFSGAFPLPLGSHGERERVRGGDVAGAAGGAG